MPKRIQLTNVQVYETIKNREFGPDIIASNKKVAVIMTQDWCPQWSSMKTWMELLDDVIQLDIYELVYNRSEYFREFLSVKENIWNNREIPYIRYYREGTLVRKSIMLQKMNSLRVLTCDSLLRHKKGRNVWEEDKIWTPLNASEQEKA